MRVLHGTRIFSGLEKSLIDNVWQPTKLNNSQIFRKIRKNFELYVMFLLKILLKIINQFGIIQKINKLNSMNLKTV